MRINDQGFNANRGEILLDAALGNGVDVPHDCRAGQCGSCKVKVIDGVVIGGESEEPGLVKACQARIITDLEVLVEPVPEVLTTKGRVMHLTPLAPDVVEVSIRPNDPIGYLPGQYYRFQFKGFPPRYFSPTAPMDRPFDGNALRLHVRRIPGGRVSPSLGREIQPGHQVLLTGPFGHAYFRPELDNRLILVGSGTGFAPIWSIAEAAVAENPEREMVVIAAAKTVSSLYMAPAFRRLKGYPNITLIPTVSEKPTSAAKIVRQGRPTAFLPRMSPDDIVYACGAPAMVDALKDLVIGAGATFYADPFTPQFGADEEDNIVSRVFAWLSSISPIPVLGGGEQVKMLPKPEKMQQPAFPEQHPSAFRSSRGQQPMPRY